MINAMHLLFIDEKPAHLFNFKFLSHLAYFLYYNNADKANTYRDSVSYRQIQLTVWQTMKKIRAT